MKAVILTFVCVCFSAFVWGQEIELTGTYAASTSIKFQHNFGGGVGYNQFITHRSRLGFFIGYLINSTPYHQSSASTTDLSTVVRDARPHNQWVTLKISYSFNLLKSSRSLLFLGAEVGLNYFIIDEKGEQTVTTRQGDVTSGSFINNTTVNNRVGVGMLIEYELKDIICKRISPFLSINPEVMSYGRFGLMGSSDPVLIGWMNFNVGVRYTLGKKQ